MSRRLLVILLVDAVAIAALAAWWLHRAAPTVVARRAVAPAAVSPAGSAAGTGTGGDVPALTAPPLDAPDGQRELHGTFHGQPFWARLAAPSPEFGGKRRLDLVYTPPAPEAVGGWLIHDSPRLLVDDHLALVGWNNRDGATGITTTAAPTGYKLVHERHGSDGAKLELLTRSLPGAPAWDLGLAPLLLALGWSTGHSEGGIRVVDFWGPRATEQLTMRVKGTVVSIAGETWTITPDDGGHLARLVASDGGEILAVSGRP